ncbi:hypothetical protein V8V88_36735, partial [Paenibacillus phytohabitans]
MKNLFLIILAFGLSFSLAGCGGDNHAGDTNKPNETSKQGAAEKDSKAKEDEQTEPKLEIVKSTGGVWKDSIDNVWVHS